MDCRKWVDLYSTDSRLKYPSEATQKNYQSVVTQFLFRFEKYREPKEIPTQEIKEWVLEAKTINSRKHRICGVKSFYQLTVGMPNKIDRVPYPKADKKLPIVLSVSEVQSMFSVCENKKHKAILSLLYCCGLRVSELINLKWEHLDRSRGIINIIQGKGKKDRQVPFPVQLQKVLEEYWKEYKTKPYIFAGQFGEQYSARSVGEVVKQLAAKAEIGKRVYTHLMRHNSLTHMAEFGTDINLIQRIAGHSNVKTTGIYLHLSHNRISSLVTPLSQIQL